MAHGKNYHIELLNGENFYNWKFRMGMILLENGVNKYVENPLETTGLSADELEREQKKDNKARSLIVQYVNDNQLESLRERKTAYEMWKTLEEKYEVYLENCI